MANILFDEQGLIYKIEDDGSRGYGDSCAETSRYWHLEYFRFWSDGNLSSIGAYQPKANTALTKFFNAANTRDYNGIRAPREKLPASWPDPIKDFSSDQQTPWIMAMGAWGSHNNVTGIMDQNQNHYNLNPMSKNIYYRALGGKPSALRDLCLWVTVLARCGKLPFWDQGLKKLTWGNPNDVADILNLIHCFIQSKHTVESSVSKRAFAYLRANCFLSYGSYSLDYVVSENNGVKQYGLGISDPILGAIAWYYKKDNFGLVALYQWVLEKMYK